MSGYLLDTDCIIDYVVGILSSVRFVDALRDSGGALYTCSVVVAEVYSGLRPERETSTVAMLRKLSYLSTSEDAARQAGGWRYAFARRGITLTTTDCLIAATAAEHGVGVVTGNVKDFQVLGAAIVPLPRVQR